MFIHMYVCVYIYIYTHMYVCACTYIPIYIYIYIYTHLMYIRMVVPSVSAVLPFPVLPFYCFGIALVLSRFLFCRFSQRTVSEDVFRFADRATANLRTNMMDFRGFDSSISEAEGLTQA